jgi:hypothetical protein
VNRTVREWLTELEAQNPVEEPTHSQDKVSTTDADSTYATKGGTPARIGYYNNYLVDNQSCIIVGVQATGARLSEESRAAEEMITLSLIKTSTDRRPKPDHRGTLSRVSKAAMRPGLALAAGSRSAAATGVAARAPALSENEARRLMKRRSRKADKLRRWIEATTG